MEESILLRKSLCTVDAGPLSTPYGFVEFDVGRHAEPARKLLNMAYAHGGGLVQPFKSWWPALVSDDEYDPDLIFVVEDSTTSDLVGFAQCWTSGFIKDIAVAHKHRRNGIASALLIRIFVTFKVRGLASVTLKVQANNRSGALELYQALGMVAD